MCGIAGKLNFSGQPIPRRLIDSMTDAIEHRGPDDQGAYVHGAIGIGNRRLSIIDLEHGHQPIANEDESVWVVFNGEIYNYTELHGQLAAKGHVFRTRSDTETIVHLYEEHGADFVRQLNGMFAIAIWDERSRKLILARDRMGEKPLFYALTRDALVFGSEMAAVMADHELDRTMDPEALDLYLGLQYIPSPWTILRSVRKLPAAHILIASEGRVDIRCYWDAAFDESWTGTEADARHEVRTLLEDSVKRRLISDVPVGALLSGGIDSSTIVALAARLSAAPLKTFSVGFDGDAHGELPYAERIARRYGTDHHVLDVRSRVVDVLPMLIRHYGEPFGDCSAVATHAVAQLAATKVKVALSGDGGDEMFGGYPWYVDAFAPQRIAGSYLRDAVVATGDGLRDRRMRPIFGAVKGAAIGLRETAGLWRAPLRAYRRATTFFSPRERWDFYTPEMRVALSAGLPDAVSTTRRKAPGGRTSLSTLQYIDQHLYLPDDILVKVDIASMACSLETRAPFLDHRLVERLASLPESMKVRRGVTKWLLRSCMDDLLPVELLARPKVGFGVPVDRWLREDLRAMVQDLLLGPDAAYARYLDREPVASLVAYHLAGRTGGAHKLWLLLVFELWLREVHALRVPSPILTNDVAAAT